MPSGNRSRVAPTIMVILLLVVLAVVAPLLAQYHPDPAVWVAKIQAMSIRKPSAPSVDLKHSVWVNRRSGLYYCRQSKFYGRMLPGRSMRQGAALQEGFRPAQGQACP
jgi:hypothetical protein